MRLSSSGGSTDREWSFTWSPSCQGQPPAAWLTEGGLASHSLSVPPPARLQRNKAITPIIMIRSQWVLADSTISSEGADIWSRRVQPSRFHYRVDKSHHLALPSARCTLSISRPSSFNSILILSYHLRLDILIRASRQVFRRTLHFVMTFLAASG